MSAAAVSHRSRSGQASSVRAASSAAPASASTDVARCPASSSAPAKRPAPPNASSASPGGAAPRRFPDGRGQRSDEMAIPLEERVDRDAEGPAFDGERQAVLASRDQDGALRGPRTVTPWKSEASAAASSAASRGAPDRRRPEEPPVARDVLEKRHLRDLAPRLRDGRLDPRQKGARRRPRSPRSLRPGRHGGVPGAKYPRAPPGRVQAGAQAIARPARPPRAARRRGRDRFATAAAWSRGRASAWRGGPLPARNAPSRSRRSPRADLRPGPATAPARRRGFPARTSSSPDKQLSRRARPAARDPRIRRRPPSGRCPPPSARASRSGRFAVAPGRDPGRALTGGRASEARGARGSPAGSARATSSRE